MTIRDAIRPGALAALLALAACGRGAPAPAPEAASFRNAEAPIGSTTRGVPADIGGEWVVSSAFPGAPFARPGTRVAVAPGAAGTIVWRFDGTAVPTTVAAPGRYRAEAAEIWVVWVDDDFRTAAVGTPDGSFGWIMDRPGAAAPDRTRAARDMLAFSGYDVAQLAGDLAGG